MGPSKFKTASVVGLTVVALGVVGYGMLRALHSSLFTVRVVEIADLPEDSPLDAKVITDLAAVPVGNSHLVDLDLKSIETRLMSEPWIKEVHLQKQFPQTVSIAVGFRKPRALFQNKNGAVSYIDQDGAVFGRLTLKTKADLPLVSLSEKQIPDALKLLDLWERAELDRFSQISSLGYEEERGFKATVTYPLVKASNFHQRGRATVEFGLDLTAPEFEAQLGRLRQVFQYLGENGVSARQIFAGADKKIVVKIAHGS